MHFKWLNWIDSQSVTLHFSDVIWWWFVGEIAKEQKSIGWCSSSIIPIHHHQQKYGKIGGCRWCSCTYDAMTSVYHIRKLETPKCENYLLIMSCNEPPCLLLSVAVWFIHNFISWIVFCIGKCWVVHVNLDNYFMTK